MNIPKDILNIIEDYRMSFQIIESLPKMKGVQNLIDKSNMRLLQCANDILEIPSYILLELLHYSTAEPPLTFLVASDLHEQLNECLMYSLQTHHETGCLFWLFITRTPNIYFGPYATMFERSVFFKFLTLVTNPCAEL